MLIILYSCSDSGNPIIPPISGCTNPDACNYNEIAEVDDGSCINPINEVCVSFENDIQPIFNSNCTGCHGSLGNLDLGAGVSHNNLVNVISSGYAPVLRVSSGDTANSVLWHKVSGTGEYGDQMPQNGQLSQEDIDLIKNWIKEGAVNNTDS